LKFVFLRVLSSASFWSHLSTSILRPTYHRSICCLLDNYSFASSIQMYSDFVFLGELQSIPHKSIVVGTTTMTTRFGQPKLPKVSHNNNGGWGNFREFLGICWPHKSIVETTTIVEQNLGNQASKVSHNNLMGWEILGGSRCWFFGWGNQN